MAAPPSYSPYSDTHIIQSLLPNGMPVETGGILFTIVDLSRFLGERMRDLNQSIYSEGRDILNNGDAVAERLLKEYWVEPVRVDKSAKRLKVQEHIARGERTFSFSGMSLRLCSDFKRRHRRIRRNPDENGSVSSHLLKIYMITIGIPPCRRGILRRVRVLARRGSQHINAPI